MILWGWNGFGFLPLKLNSAKSWFWRVAVSFEFIVRIAWMRAEAPLYWAPWIRNPGRSVKRDSSRSRHEYRVTSLPTNNWGVHPLPMWSGTSLLTWPEFCTKQEIFKNASVYILFCVICATIAAQLCCGDTPYAAEQRPLFEKKAGWNKIYRLMTTSTPARTSFRTYFFFSQNLFSAK